MPLSDQHEAAGAGHIEVVRLLLAAGADVHARIETHHPIPLTPLALAAKKGHTKLVQMLLEAGATQVDWALFLAAKKGHADTAQALLQARAKVIGGDTGCNAFYRALLESHEPIIRMFIEHDTETLHGEKPLFKAAYDNDYKLAQRILKYDTHVDATDNQGETPLEITMRDPNYPNFQTACVLVQHGADLNRVRNLTICQNKPKLRRILEYLSRKRIRTIDSSLGNQGVPHDVVHCRIFPLLTRSESRLSEFKEIRRANADWSTHKELYESIE